MILWFTGQPGSGKTTLCNEIQEKILYSHYYLKDKIIHIDGDDLRKALNNKDYSGIKPLQNALKLIVARSRNPNNRLLKDMLVDAGDDSDLRGLGGVQKAQEKLQFIAAELTDNAIRQYRAAGIDDTQINTFLEPYKDMFKQIEETSISTSTSNVPTYVIDPKTKKLKLKK